MFTTLSSCNAEPRRDTFTEPKQQSRRISVVNIERRDSCQGHLLRIEVIVQKWWILVESGQSLLNRPYFLGCLRSKPRLLLLILSQGLRYEAEEVHVSDFVKTDGQSPATGEAIPCCLLVSLPTFRPRLQSFNGTLLEAIFGSSLGIVFAA